MNKVRGFEKVSFRQYQKDSGGLLPVAVLRAEYDAIRLPRRATRSSAGYDFFAPREIVLVPGQSVVIATGVKAYMQEDEWLAIHVRSGHGFKYNIRLKNQVGVIDADYYDNPGNEGHIMIALQNEGPRACVINPGQAFAQGIFHKYLLADDDRPLIDTRFGGFSSTDRR